MSTITQKSEKCVTFTNAEDFLKILHMVNEISSEIHFFKVDDNIEIRNLSPDHVCMLNIKSNTSSIQYEQTEDAQEFYLGFKITKDIINEVKKLDLTKGIFITENGIYDYNSNGIKIEKIEDRKFFKIPKFNANKVTLQLSEIKEFKNFLELTKKLCSKITFKADDNAFTVFAKTDNFKNELSLLQYPITEIIHIDDFEQQGFYIQYINILTKILPKDLEFLSLSFGNKVPMKIDFKLHGLDVTYFIAPLLEN